jgi:alpha-glucosidase
VLSPLDPHHDGSRLYRPREPELGARVPVRVWVPHTASGASGADQVVLRSVHDGEPHFAHAVQESLDEYGAWWSARLHLHNPSTSYRFLLSTERAGARWLNGSGVHARDVTDAGDFRVSTRHAAPGWLTDQVGYQIFPDRFEHTETGIETPAWAHPVSWDEPVEHLGSLAATQLYGGTLDGIVDRLGHLVELGVNLLYLTPIFESRSNHRYDAVSFDRVDPLLGGDAALDRLISAAHDRGIRVMGDLTTNHTGAGHEWFTMALADPASVEREFYLFDGDEYAMWMGHPTLPKLNHASAELARRLYDGPTSVVARWLAAGLDGWRVDVANMSGRYGVDDFNLDLARTVRRTMAATRPDAWLLAEHGHDAGADLEGSGWHGTMDYAGFTRPAWCWLNAGAAPAGMDYLSLPIDVPDVPAHAAVTSMREVHAAMPWQSRTASTMHLDSHDMARLRTVTGGGTSGWIDTKGHGRDRHLVGVALQMTMPGVPVLFMGDEIGLTAVDGEHARTPFPWARRSEWDEETLTAYRHWIALRHAHVALREGGLRWLSAEVDTMTYLREHPDQTLLIHLSRRAADDTVLPLGALGPRHHLQPLVGSRPEITAGHLVLSNTGAAATVAVCR